MSYEYYEQLNELKRMLIDLGIYDKLNNLKDHIAELEEKINTLSEIQDNILRKVKKQGN